MEYVNVIFMNGKKGTIMQKEYDDAKDKGYILGLESDEMELEIIPKSKPMPSENKVEKKKYSKKS